MLKPIPIGWIWSAGEVVAKPIGNDRWPKPTGGALSLLTVVIPARDEAENIESTVEHLHRELEMQEVPHEILVVDDGSLDDTWCKLGKLKEKIAELNLVQNDCENGFGNAIIKGIDSAMGDAVVIMMADESDDCHDVSRYWQKLNEGWDCVFGSRFIKGGSVIDYPLFKLMLNKTGKLDREGTVQNPA